MSGVGYSRGFTCHPGGRFGGTGLCTAIGPCVQDPTHLVRPGFVVHEGRRKHEVKSLHPQRGMQAAGQGLDGARRLEQFPAGDFAPDRGFGISRIRGNRRNRYGIQAYVMFPG